MFRFEKIKHFKVKKIGGIEQLWIKYPNEPESFLTTGLVDMEDYMEKQGIYWERARRKVIEKSKGWLKRHKKSLYFKGLTD